MNKTFLTVFFCLFVLGGEVSVFFTRVLRTMWADLTQLYWWTQGDPTKPFVLTPQKHPSGEGKALCFGSNGKKKKRCQKAMQIMRYLPRIISGKLEICSHAFKKKWKLEVCDGRRNPVLHVGYRPWRTTSSMHENIEYDLKDDRVAQCSAKCIFQKRIEKNRTPARNSNTLCLPTSPTSSPTHEKQRCSQLGLSAEHLVRSAHVSLHCTLCGVSLHLRPRVVFGTCTEVHAGGLLALNISLGCLLEVCVQRQQLRLLCVLRWWDSL